jgi:DNA repair protein RadC
MAGVRGVQSVLEGRQRAKPETADAGRLNERPSASLKTDACVQTAPASKSKRAASKTKPAAAPPAEHSFCEAPCLPAKTQEPPHYYGHRERLRERFRTGGPEALPDYELMELLLFRAIPRRDTKPLAKEILKKFGTFAEAISADWERLAEVEGLGRSAIFEIKLLQAAALRLTRGNAMQRPVLNAWSTVIEHCKAAMAYEKREQFRVLFLDHHHHLIGEEVQSRGTVNHTPVYVREVVKRALELSATGVVLVHNHPSGNPDPSAADIDMTKKIERGLKAVEIALYDHFIIGKNGHASLKAQGYF